jgi:hypothetical protein
MLLPVPFQYTVHEQSIKALEAQCIEKDNRIADLEKELNIYKTIVHQQ